MSDGKDDLLRQADVCFRRSLSADRFSAPFWLALSQQWVRMAADVAPAGAPPEPGMSSPTISSADLVWLNGPLGESLPERARAATAAKGGSTLDRCKVRWTSPSSAPSSRPQGNSAGT